MEGRFLFLKKQAYELTMNFDYRSFPNKVYFGYGKIELLPELLKGYPKIMVIATQRLSDQLFHLRYALGEERVVHFSKVIQHVPDTLVKEASEFRKKHQPDVVVAIGGGSAIGLAKALARERYIPQVAIPSTFSGSEQTNIYGISSAEGKTTGRDDKVLPGMVIYDPYLTLSMPKQLAVTSAMNAMAHLMEALYAIPGNPLTSTNAILGMKAIKKGMEELHSTEHLTESANEKILFGAYLAGKCLCEVAMSLHHKAAHVLGGSFGMEHSKVHTVLQSYVLAYQWPHLSDAIQSNFRDALGSDDPPKILKEMAARAGAQTNLKSIGFKATDIEKAAGLIAAQPYVNVAPITKEGLIEMLTNAYEGKRSFRD